MSGAVAGMALQCTICGHRPAEDSVVEALLLHFQVVHDTDDVTLDLRAICECGAAMILERTEREANGQSRDHFKCHACGKRGAIRRGS